MSKQSSSTDTTKTVEVTGHSQGPKSTRVEAADAEFVVGRDASPLDHVLGALSGCINIVGHLVAKERGIAIDDLTVELEGDVDPAKYQGKDDEPRAGFQEIRLAVTVDADADAETLQDWIEAVEERCPVADNLRNDSTVDVTVARA